MGAHVPPEGPQPAHAMARWLDALEAPSLESEGAWTHSQLNQVEKAIAGRIQYTDPVTGRRQQTGGYKFLRWALVGLENGPSLSSVMEVLGREETRERLREALYVAQELHKIIKK